MRKNRVETCIDCSGNCDLDIDEQLYVKVPGKSIGMEQDEVDILLDTVWLDKAVKKLGFACLDDFWSRDDSKNYLLMDLGKLATHDKAIIKTLTTQR